MLIRKFTSTHLQIISFCIIMLISQACATSPEEKIKKIAESYQNKCPQSVDEYTVMQNVEALLPEKTLLFSYRIKATIGEDIKKEFQKKVENEVKPILISKVKNVDEYDFYIKNDVKFEHIYIDIQGDTVANVKITPLDYK